MDCELLLRVCRQRRTFTPAPNGVVADIRLSAVEQIEPMDKSRIACIVYDSAEKWRSLQGSELTGKAHRAWEPVRQLTSSPATGLRPECGASAVGRTRPHSNSQATGQQLGD